VHWNDLFTSNYLNNRAIGDYDQDECEPACGDADCPEENRVELENEGSHYLDDVTRFLHEQDIINTGNDNNGAGVSFEEPPYERQSITTHIIAFGEDTSGLPLLERAATQGGGKMLYAQSSTTLMDALTSIIGSISQSSANFISPVVPVSKMNRVYSGNSMYLGLFKPQPDGRLERQPEKAGL
jgi:hypothetical protein